jgi:hypothetical protein
MLLRWGKRAMKGGERKKSGEMRKKRNKEEVKKLNGKFLSRRGGKSC